MTFMQLLRPSIYASAIALCLTTSVGHAQLNLELPDTNNLPNLGSTASSALSTTEERLMGKLLFREIRKRRALVEDPELSGWIRALGNRLTRHAPASGSNFYFSIEKDSAVNAYAMAGGVIVIHSGLILNTSSESELAAVMAHEIAHVTQRHIARMIANNKKNPLITGAGFLAGAVVASKSSEAAQAIMMGTMGHKRTIILSSAIRQKPKLTAPDCASLPEPDLIHAPCRISWKNWIARIPMFMATLQSMYAHTPCPLTA